MSGNTGDDSTHRRPTEGQERLERNPLRRNPTLQIWLIAAVFYAILVGMFLFVLVLIIRG
jgi:hypothetical protein